LDWVWCDNFIRIGFGFGLGWFGFGFGVTPVRAQNVQFILRLVVLPTWESSLPARPNHPRIQSSNAELESRKDFAEPRLPEKVPKPRFRRWDHVRRAATECMRKKDMDRVHAQIS